MRIRRVSFAVFLILLSPLYSWTQSSASAWGRPSGVRSAELLSVVDLKTVVLLFLGAVLLLGCCFLVSTLLSARQTARVSGSGGIFRKGMRAPDLNLENSARTAVLRRLPPSPALLAAGNGKEEKEEPPSRSGEKPGRG